jgi:hypothetical protein
MKMRFKTITDIRECRILWEKFSPKNSVWDLWDIAYSFHKGYCAEPFFILGSEEDKELGILHLQKEKDGQEEWLDFFAGNYPERRTFYILNKALLDKFLAHAPKETYLTYISPSEKDFAARLEKDEITYSLDLEKYDYNLDDYLATFNKKHRKNIKYDIRQLEKLDCRLLWNAKDHLLRLAELNKLKFGDESNFEEPQFLKSIQLMIDSAEKLNILHMLSIKINNKVEASQIALFHNKTYTVLTGGSNQEIKNLGKLLIIEHIKKAAELKADTVDFMTTESGWKKLWNLDETMLYKFEN